MRVIIINYLSDRRKRLHELLLTLINKESSFELIEEDSSDLSASYSDNDNINLSRVIEKNQNITIDWDAWDRPEIFNLIQKEGSVPEDDIRTSMNLGIGLVLIVSKEKVNIFEDYFKSQDEPYYLIGNIK